MKNLKYTLISTLLATIACASSAIAGTPDETDKVAMDKPSFFASQSMTVTAEVEAIDHETRVVTVRKPDGEALTFTASEEVRNLPQVEVGDVLVAEYVESVSIEVMADDGKGTEAAEIAGMARAKEGEMPGFAAMDTIVLVATVEEINVEANTFKLKGPDGSINEYVARNPQNLKRAVVGDIVVMTTTAAVAIAVEHQPDE